MGVRGLGTVGRTSRLRVLEGGVYGIAGKVYGRMTRGGVSGTLPPAKHDASDRPIRPNGPGERSPGPRPKADALGGEMMTTRCGLTGRETVGPAFEGRG
jgi:hypothetical protein